MRPKCFNRRDVSSGPPVAKPPAAFGLPQRAGSLPHDSASCGGQPAIHLKSLTRCGFSPRPDPGILILPQTTRLDLTLRPQYIALPAAGPFSDLRRGFFHPRTIEPAWRSPSNEGWAQEGCSDSSKLLK